MFRSFLIVSVLFILTGCAGKMAFAPNYHGSDDHLLDCAGNSGDICISEIYKYCEREGTKGVAAHSYMGGNKHLFKCKDKKDKR